MATWRSIRVATNSEFADLSIRKLLDRYGNGSLSVRTTIGTFEKTPVAIEPGIGGRKLSISEVRAGDIILATTDQPGDYGIITQDNRVSRALICVDNQRIIDSKNQTFVDVSLASILDTTQTMVVFRIQLSSQANQVKLGERLAQKAIENIGKLPEMNERPRWVQVPEPYFAVDRFVFGKSTASRRKADTWLGLVHLGISRTNERFTPFYCSWLFLQTLTDVATAEPENTRFWFTTDDYWRVELVRKVSGGFPPIITIEPAVMAKLEKIRIFQPIGYVGHLKGSN